jgi:CelD/BcsL family acetyltransferase involved in cellulose biosynthesis
MQIDIIQTLPAFNALAEEWNTLVKNSASDVPFLHHEYLSTWWQTLGGGEWAEAALYIITARQSDRSLAGIAPLFLSQNRDGVPALMLLGSIEISDYLDLIAPPNLLPEFVEQLFTHLDSPQAPAWRVLDWYNILDTSETLKIIASAAERRGWLYTQEVYQHCPYIPLPGDWEIYLAGIDKKQRHEIRRKIRRFENQEEPTRWYIVEDGKTLDQEMDAFLDMMAQDVDKRRFLTPIMREQMKLAAKAFFNLGWLQLSFLEVGGRKAASYLNLDYKDHLWIYNSALNFDFREISAGWVLLGYLLQWANENKRKAFDFMRGDEDYKYRFGAIDRRVMRAVIRRDG